MTPPRDPDAILAAWLEDGPLALPEATKRAIAVTTRTTHRSRLPNWWPWRNPNMNGMNRLLAAAAAIVVVVGGLYVLRPGADRSGVGGQEPPVPSASPTPSPVPSSTPSPLDTSGWVVYESDRYGFSISHPDDWTENSADHDWTFEKDIVAWESTGVDSFLNAESLVRARSNRGWRRIARGRTQDRALDYRMVP